MRYLEYFLAALTLIAGCMIWYFALLLFTVAMLFACLHERLTKPVIDEEEEEAHGSLARIK